MLPSAVWQLFYKFLKKQPPEAFSKNRVVKQFIGKHMCCSLFFKIVTGLNPAQFFPVNFGKFLRTSVFTEHLQRLLLFLVFGHLFAGALIFSKLI